MITRSVSVVPSGRTDQGTWHAPTVVLACGVPPAGLCGDPSPPPGTVSGWKSILNTLAITYGDRLDIN